MCRPCALGNPQMTNTLLLLSSARGAASLSTRIATVLADRFAAAPGSKVQVHDLAAEALAHTSASVPPVRQGATGTV
jgi:FMN-dependent NADH-azoreductase